MTERFSDGNRFFLIKNHKFFEKNCRNQKEVLYLHHKN